MMNEICRLCLTISNEIMPKLTEDSDILFKLRTSMSIQISINESLPNQVCNVCTKKIDDIYEFHKEITHNECKLLSCLKNDKELHNFYYELKNIVKIKDKMHPEDDNFSEGDNLNLEDIKDDPSNQSNVSSLRIMYDKSIYETHSSLDSITNNKKINNVKTEIDDSADNVKLSKLKEKKTKLNKKSDPNTNITNGKLNLDIEVWNCLTCFLYCDSQSDLIKHYEMVHNRTDNKDVDIELKQSNNPSNKRAVLKCNVSGKTYEKKHRKDTATHKYERPYVCKLCGRTYKTVYEIIRHGRAHNGSKLFCSFKCGYSTAYKGALKEHEKRRHGKSNYKYTCEKCGKGFPVKTWHDQHQNVHNNLKPFVCDICGLAFHMHRYLTTHRSTVHPQSSSVKRYKCIQCLLPCDSKMSLRLHMKEHGIKTNLLCDMCGKVFSNAEQLKYHKNVHFGVKPYSCSVCNKKFTKKFNMKQHELTHTGERTHACNVCGKFYTQRSALLRHNRSHHAE